MLVLSPAFKPRKPPIGDFLPLPAIQGKHPGPQPRDKPAPPLPQVFHPRHGSIRTVARYYIAASEYPEVRELFPGLHAGQPHFPHGKAEQINTVMQQVVCFFAPVQQLFGYVYKAFALHRYYRARSPE
jgi:hypothetical protein